jgi:signal transduction histidine kinase
LNDGLAAEREPNREDRPSLAAQIFPGRGEVAGLIRATDWSRTPLGPIESWPQSLRTAVSICLGSRHPIVLWWGPERWMFYNDAYRPMLGASKHPQFLGAPGRDCWFEIWDTIGPMMEQVIATGEATWSENLFLLMFRHGYLEETYFTFSYSPILDEAGRPSGIFNACAESTAQVLGERRLKALRELTVEPRTTGEAARQCAEVLGRNPRDVPFALLYLLDATGQRFELAGQSGLEPGSPASPLAVSAVDGGADGWPLSRVAAQGRPEIVEDIDHRFDGLPRAPWDEPAHQAMLVPLAHPGWEKPAGVLVLGISPRRAFDEDYRGFFGLVASHVATALANARAYEAERERAEKLAELDRVKTEFFSNVSHEFRTPLTLILGPLEDALGGPARALGGEALESVHRSALRLLKLVNSLLDFSRVEAARLRSSFEPTDLSRLTAGLAGTFKSLLERAGLKLVVDCAPLGQPVHVDPSQWEKIVLNLLSNAFKFTFEGEIAVRLRTSGDQVELAVTDTGTGIPADELPRVFDRFHRVEGARGRSFEGSGIGLALVRELVTQHGGSVRAESTVGKGSTFVVALPLGRAHLPADPLSPGDRSATEVTAAPYLVEARHWGASGPAATEVVRTRVRAPDGMARARVLVADDNADMREYLVRLLAPHWDVDVAEDGQAALEAALADPPDLLLSDVMMPRMDGVALLKALRADPRTARITMVLLSARAGEEAVVAGLETGADDYLAKPFSANELLARVRGHLEMSRLRREWIRQLEVANQELKTALGEAQVARQEAVAASRAKSEFLATMSHEIRTPLNAVIGFAGLLGDSELTGQQRQFVEAMRTSGAHVVDIINDILDFSKLQSGRFEISPAPCALRPLLESALDAVAGRAADKGLELAYRMGPEVPARIEADEARVRQILVNYLGNAIKFTARGEVVLEVRVSASAGGSPELLFSVRDTGMGIPADRMDRLFKEFSQADASVAVRYGGTGLGLAICGKLAELQGGRVWAESQPGVGSSFHFALPAVARAEAGPSAPPARETLRGLQALIVDDNRTSLEILRAHAELWGMSVRATQDPAEALSWLEGGAPFDLVLADQDMPGLEGLELARRIRGMRSGAKIPIVLFSGLRESARLARAAQPALATVLTKPIRQSELFDRIERVVRPPVASERGGPARPASAPPALSILLAEDNVLNQKVALVLLERLGYPADVACDGAQALQALDRKAYDVVLMDMRMPRMDGLEATRAIRARGASIRQPRIIALTANAMIGDREACLTAGMDDYISKPVDRNELLEALQRASQSLAARAAGR